MLAIPYLQSVGGFFYDFPELALFAIATAVALSDRWKLLPIVALLGTLNKESFLLFLITLYPILAQGKHFKSARRWLLLSALVSFAVFIAVHLRFENNPGGSVEFWAGEHLRMLTNPLSMALATEETYGVRCLRSSTILPLVLLGWTMVRSRRCLSVAIRRHAVLAASINLPLYILFCYPGEMRDLSLLYPTLALSIGCISDAVSCFEIQR